MRTPGNTPNRTPKGFRALFSLWEGGGRKDSPQKGRKNASQTNEPGPLPDPSPLKTSTTSSIPEVDNKTPGAGADAAASPAVVRAEQCEAAEDSTWGSNWQSSNPDATAEVGSLDIDLHHQANDSVEDNTLKSMAEQEVNLRASYPPKTGPESVSKCPDLQPSDAPNSLTPDLLKENSRTPSTFGITPPTLRPSAAKPGSAEAAAAVGKASSSPAVKSPSKSPLPAIPSNTGTPSPACVQGKAARASPAGADGVDDAMVSNPRTSASFGTCPSHSPELADEGTNCSVHAGCTPACPLRTQRVSPAPSSGPHGCPKDPRLNPEAAAAVNATMDASECKPIGRHRHQRSGALDFDASLLAAEEDSKVDQENAVSGLQDVPDALFITADEDDVRGSGATVDTTVVHSPSMGDVPDDGPERSLSPNKYATLDQPVPAFTAPQHPVVQEKSEVDDGADAADASCPSYPLNVSSSTLGADQQVSNPTSKAPSPMDVHEDAPVGRTADVSTTDAPDIDAEAPPALESAPQADDLLMQSPVPVQPSSPQVQPRAESCDIGGAQFQFDTAMEGATPVAFGSARLAEPDAGGSALVPQLSSDVHMEGASPAVCAPPAEASPVAAGTCDLEPQPSTVCTEAVPEQPSTSAVNSVGTPTESVQPGSAVKSPALSAGKSPAAESSSPRYQAARAASSIPRQPSSAQSRETPPPEQDPTDAAQCETTPKQSGTAAADIETPDSTPVAVAIARCREALNSGQEALERDSEAGDNSVTSAPGSTHSRHQGPASGAASPARSGPPTSAILRSSPLKTTQGGFSAHTAAVAASEGAPTAEPSVSEARVSPATTGATPAENTEPLQQQSDLAAPVEMECEDETPEEDRTVKVEHKLSVNSDESAKVTPPNLGSQGSHPLSVPIPDDDNISDGAKSTGCLTPTGNTGTSELRSPVPCFSPAQHATVANRGESQPDAVHDKPPLVIDAGDNVTMQLHDVHCSYEGTDDATVDGSDLNNSSTWRPAVGVNDSMDSVAARSQADSIFGIASDICRAAVGGALTSSYGGINTAAPRSPLPSGIHTRAGSVLTQRTHATPYSSVDTDNLLASTDLSAPPSIAARAGVAPDSAAAATAALQMSQERSSQERAGVLAESPAMNADQPDQPDHAQVPDEHQHTAEVPEQRKDVSTKPPSAGVPSLPPVPQQDLTPEGVAQAFAQQPARCSSGGAGSGAFRVTDSCADRVWRMLRGNVEDEQGDEGLKLQAIASTADEDQGRSWRDSLPVPELPTMDVSEFEALETEALKYSSKGRRSVSVDPSVASPALQAAAKTSSPNVHVPEASGTPPGDVPKPEMCNSPSLDGPTVCASPRVLGGTAERLKTKGGSRKSSQNHSAAPGSAVAATADSSEADKLAADSKEMAIKHALVNQSLTGAALPQTADCEQLLTESVDLGDAVTLSGPHRALGIPCSSMVSLPEDTDLPSPGDVPVRKSDWNVLESREWRNVAEEERPLTAPQFGATGRVDSLRIPAVNDADPKPLTSTFDATAVTSLQGGAKRPTTPSRRHKSNISRSKHSPCSQPLRAATAVATSSSPRSPTTTKRSLSRRTIANITPNHNPNFLPNSPGKTPDPVPVNPSPSAKRSRRSNKAAPSPVSTGGLLRQSSENEVINGPPRVSEDCGKALEYGDSAADIDMHGASPIITPGGGNRHSDLLKVSENSPLTGSRVQQNPMSRSTPNATHTARGTRATPGSVRASTGLMRVPEGSEMGEEGPEKASLANRAAKDSDTERRSLRKSLLNIDPMRVSYGTDGLINLAGASFYVFQEAMTHQQPGEDDCVLFQTDIRAITAALDEFPDRPSTAPAQPSSRGTSLDILAGPTSSSSPRLGNSKRSEGPSSGGNIAKSAGERLTKSPAAFGVSPLRASRVAAAKAAAAGTGNGTLNVSTVGLGEGGAEECADVGELQLRLALALRQAEHWRREMDMHAEATHQTSHELDTLRDENRNLRNQTQKLQDKVERQQNVIDAEAFLEGGDRDHTTSLLGDDFANNLRAQEDFEAQKHQLQEEINRWKEKYATVANDLLPRAQSDASLAKEDLKAAQNVAKAAHEEALVAKQKMDQMRVQAEQKERHLLREVNTLRTELNKQNLRVNEAVAAQNSLQERVQSLQKEANEKDGLYHAKCKELSVAKIRGAPSGIGGGIGAGKLKQQLETVTLERNTLLERLHTLERRSGR